MGASVDQQTGNLSVFEVLEELRVPQLPMPIPALVLSVSMEKAEPGPFEGKVFIHFIQPDGSNQLLGNGEMRVPSEQKRVKAVFRFGGFPVTQFGVQRFVVSWVNGTGAKVGEAVIDFDVVQAAEAPAADPSRSH